MNEDQHDAPIKEDIGHEIGEHNIEWFGLDIHNPVFAVSAVMVIAFVIGTLLFIDQAATAFTGTVIANALLRYRHVLSAN